MAEYIDREAVIEKFRRMLRVKHGMNERFFADSVFAVIENFTAADVEPVRHGHWLVKQTALGKSYTICSNCEYDFVVEIDGHFSHLDLTGMPRCPNCGAKMDEVSK